ncbi:hypothetical protein BX661DRAFT_182238 [Kickxella alabastrina]|uniref:uncharacterized protein n=1 Tax=Kickxella alabastrina TaxID=61397 RepID=UPI00221F8F55|nr:uncharacterized protein BX661DRAFT_192456 [Kickxella alabastrina]XP_051390269.1 uncharacterized protein BX661DRAFT_185614 [Kickxella alabastrina]XP_051392044.1 uncharacterized protein BX661DRAFT_182238 [Kickxella alabastrina]KAI7817734.1 hypothetical protein BX661DRAFT_192456 [Kickxella alabastrina]KAI7824602.1 hypothetical protein BX661DRAFT_185614 [Kickxella alabastrina]KAI7828520.1 hypothetical protein BX661DRAFT_182238 [Kickxella alabastrina]
MDLEIQNVENVELYKLCNQGLPLRHATIFACLEGPAKTENDGRLHGLRRPGRMVVGIGADEAAENTDIDAVALVNIDINNSWNSEADRRGNSCASNGGDDCDDKS